MSKKVRVRFAPSPTGPLHMGGVRTALYNYLFAKSKGGDFILRIEDTDEKRLVEGARDYIIESLKWCGIEPNEGVGYGGEKGPYVQSQRRNLYQPYAKQLLESRHAYMAFDTTEDLDTMRKQAQEMGQTNWQYNGATRSAMKNSLSLSKEEVEKRLNSGEPYTIRFKLPRNIDIKFEDEIRGWVTVNTNNLDDKVLYKETGMPTYHIANIIDDHLMEITHVIRGEEWLPSAPLHVLLYQAMGWEVPKFAHLPLILRPDGNGKLSKRDGDKLGFPVFPLNWKSADGEHYSGYRETGYFAEAFVNMLAFLGWNPGSNDEIFSLDGLVKEFKLERVGKSGARFDPAKAKWFNQVYLRAKSDDELVDLLKPILESEGLKSDDSLAKICAMMKERASFVSDILNDGNYFFEDEITEYDEKTIRKKWKDDSVEIMNDLINEFKALDSFEAGELERVFSVYLTKNDYGFGKVGPCFRLLVTGKGMGPSMFEICEVLGRDKVLNRMIDGIPKVEQLKTKESA